MDVPGDLLYTTDHEWVRTHEKSNGVVSVMVGITAYASDALGDVVFIDLPSVGSTVTFNESIGELESTKSVSDLYAPLNGAVTKVNNALAETPGLVNSDPYGQGWLCEIAVTNDATIESLLDAASYRELIGE